MKDLVNIVFEENYNKGRFKGNEEKLEILINHSKKVCKVALELCSRLSNITKDDIRLIKIAATLHDVQKWTGFRHNRYGAQYILENCNYKDEDKKLIALMIRWHKENGYEKSLKGKMLKMVEIVRVSDKISKLYKIDKSELDKEFIIVNEKINSLFSKDVKREGRKMLNNAYREIKNSI